MKLGFSKFRQDIKEAKETGILKNGLLGMEHPHLTQLKEINQKLGIIIELLKKKK